MLRRADALHTVIAPEPLPPLHLPSCTAAPSGTRLGRWRTSRRIEARRRRYLEQQTPALIAPFSLVLLALAAAAELLVALGDPRLGIGLHICLLALALTLSALTYDPRVQGFLLTFALAPMIRLISTGMPLPAFAQPLWYLLTSIPLFSAGFLIARELGVPRALLGLRLPSMRDLPLEFAVWVSGLGLGYAEWWILRPAPILDTPSPPILAGTALILFVCTGLLEEFLFRGLLQCAAQRLLGPGRGILFSAMLFAVLHIGHRSALDIPFVAAVGLYFSLVVAHTRSLLGVTLAHGTINVMLFIVLPLCLSS